MQFGSSFQFKFNLSNIRLLALCYNEDITKFGMNSILEIIVKDLKILATKGF